MQPFLVVVFLKNKKSVCLNSRHVLFSECPCDGTKTNYFPLSSVPAGIRNTNNLSNTKLDEQSPT